MAKIIAQLVAYTKLSVAVTLPGFLFAVAIVLSQVQAPNDAPPARSPLKVLLEWSSLDEPLTERLEKLDAELENAEADIRHAQNALVTAAEAKDKDKDNTHAATANFANAQADVKNQQALWDSTHDEIKALRTRRAEYLPTLAERLIGNIMALALLSIAIGILLRPLNAVFLRLIEGIYNSLPSERPHTPVEVRALAKMRAKDSTSDEYADVVDRYYSPVEATVGLCVPVIAICLALSKWSSLMWAAAPGLGILLLFFAYRMYVRFAKYLKEADRQLGGYL